jgi:mono/diheme cytochrome c family protein
MTHRPTICAATLFVASLLIPITSIAQKDQPPSTNHTSVYAELAKTPKKVVLRRNPLANDSEAIPAGGKLFALHCAECHGEMAEGGKKAPSLLVDEVQRATPGTLFWVLTNGVVRKGMPVWSKLPDAQRWQLVTYIKSLGVAANPAGPESSEH